MKGTRALAGACVGVVAVAEVAAVALSWDLERYDPLLSLLNQLVAVTVGALILARHPRHPVGWLLTVGLVPIAVLTDLGDAYALHESWPAARLVEWLSVSTWDPAVLLVILVVLHVPDGELRWRAVAWTGAAGVLIGEPGWLLDPASGILFHAGTNPYAVAWLPHHALWLAGSWLLNLALLGALLSLVARYRTAGPVARQQLKWVGLGVSLPVIMLPLTTFLWSPALTYLAQAADVLMTVCVGVAVLRYRLFALGRVVNRTVVYGTLTVVLAATYAASTIVLGTVLSGSPRWTTAGATLAVAAAFVPVRRRVQDLVDRRFDRDRYSARRRVEAFLDDLRAGTESPERIQDVLREVLRDDSLDLLLHLPATDGYADVRGRVAELDPSRPTLRLDRHAVVHYADPRREGEVRDAVERGLLAVEIARMNVELNRRLDRIAEVADDERRRIQRDLHDGAQQRLVTVGISLRHVEGRLRAIGLDDDAGRLDTAVADLAATIEQLRALTSRLPLTQLDAGIEAAFAELAERAPLPVVVDAAVERLDRAVEATAYFVGCEGLTNVIKHSRASAATLRAVRRNGSLVVSVSDDGVGGASARPGSGLAGLADRVHAAGGRLRVDSGSHGTLLTAELPCG